MDYINEIDVNGQLVPIKDTESGYATKNYVDTEIKQTLDYTAWEVYPTDRDLASGEFSKTFIIEGNEETFINSAKIAAGMTEQFAIYTNSPAEESDVIIDWGDGNTSSIKNGDYFSVATEDNQEYRIEVLHTYEVPNQIYTVKVYGKKYWKVAHIASKNNIMCRCIADDLPVASHLMTMANFATRADRLLYVNIPAYHKVLTIPNWANAFMGCVNLQKATGFKRFYSLYTVGNLFNTCLNLVDTDIRIPQTATDISYIFHDCKQLSKDITKLFANQNNILLGFTNDTINVQNAFYGCQKLSGAIPSQIFWNDHNVNFVGKDTCFKDCNLSSQAPINWGGTESNDIITKPEVEVVNDKVDLVSSNLSSYVTKENLAESIKDMATDQEVANAIASALIDNATTESVMEQINEAIKDLASNEDVKLEIQEAIKDMATDQEVATIISDTISTFITPLIEYTEFVLWANDTDIAKGTYLRLSETDVPEILGTTKPTDMTNVIRINNTGSTVSASLTHEFILKCPVKDISEYDIQVSWGDGTVEFATDAVKSGNDYETLLTFKHTYSEAGLYTLRITGKDYFGIPATTSENPNSELSKTNLIHKVNRIGSNVTNWANMFNWALRLFYFNISNYSSALNCKNLFNTFYNCENLITCYGFYPFVNKVTTCQNLFNRCKSLTDTDFVLPNNTEKVDFGFVFAQCISLNKPIEQFLPPTGFTQKEIKMKNCFNKCTSMTSNTSGAFSKFLWEDTSIKWVEVDAAFANNADGFAKYIPTAWGGSNTEIIVKPTIQEQVDSILPETKEYIQESLTNYATTVTVNELSTQLNDKAEKTELDNYATKQFVEDEIAKIEIPEDVDLSNYATKDYVNNQVSDKADKSLLNGLATEQFVAEQVSSKADKIEYITYSGNDIKFEANKHFTNTNILTDITLNLTKVNNTMCIFTTGDSVNLNVTAETGLLVNRPFEFLPNKTYIIAIDNNIICWSELTTL